MAYIFILSLWCEKEKNTNKKQKFYNYGKRNNSRRQKNDSYKLILKVELDEEDELLLKKRFNLLALSVKLSNEQTEILETLFGYYWYKNCEININKKYE